MVVDWLIGKWVWGLSAPMHLGLVQTGPWGPKHHSREPCCLAETPDGPRFWSLISSGSKKKEPRWACLIDAKASHRQRMWAEVSSSAPHFLHSGLSINPIKQRCLHRVLCPVRIPVTTLDCSLLKDKNLTLVPRLGPSINSRACCWELPRSYHRLWCWYPSQRPILLLRFHFETPKASSGPTSPLAEPLLARPSAVSLPLTPGCPGIQ
jgi:hypothetical protein